MAQYTIDGTTIEYISKKFGIEKEDVIELNKKYNELHSRLKEQYLAHIMRNLEDFVRETQKTPLFKITSHPSLFPLSQEVGSAVYNKGRLFDITYDCSLDPKQARAVIAHELGHLFYMVIYGKDYKEKHEPLSSVFGIFTIAGKNDFYSNRQNFLLHKSCNDIVDDFSLLRNRTQEKFNISK